MLRYLSGYTYEFSISAELCLTNSLRRIASLFFTCKRSSLVSSYTSLVSSLMGEVIVLTVYLIEEATSSNIPNKIITKLSMNINHKYDYSLSRVSLLSNMKYSKYDFMHM